MTGLQLSPEARAQNAKGRAWLRRWTKMLPFAPLRRDRMQSDDLDVLRQALQGEDATGVACGAHPADALAAVIGERRLSYLSIERVA